MILKKLEYWLLTKLIRLINFYLEFNEAEESQGDINDMIADKNRLILRRKIVAKALNIEV